MRAIGWPFGAILFALSASAAVAESGKPLLLRSTDGQSTIEISCAPGATASVAINDIIRPSLTRLPAGANVLYVYLNVEDRYWIEEWPRRGNDAVTRNTLQAKGFLIALLGREKLRVRALGALGFEFDLKDLPARLADLVAECRP